MISREQAITILKRLWRTDELKFLGEFYRPKNKDGSLIKPWPGFNAIGFFRNLSINDRKIFYPSHEALKYERNVSFKVDVVDGLEDGKYYYLELELEDEENRVENPYALKIKNVFILEEDHLSPKEFIEQWFYKKGHTPGDAATIAGQLTLNELELYTHTKRFIFELIQNADDMPDGRRDVNIEINLLSNHLLFLHNGKYFDREDVKAISDAAKSTKSKSLSQTGYKGIGFKSVFTDSTRVYIKSGDYFFKFDKLEPIYKDFYKLYKGYIDNLTPKAKREFEIEYKGREHEFTVIEKIPWQIKPIWVEPTAVPQELSSSQFFEYRQVSIALQISENVLRQKDYNGMILGLLKEPRFLLFLRNTKGFKYLNLSEKSNDIIFDISIKDKNDIIGVYNGEDLIASYIKHAFTINITNEDFLKAGLNFQKRDVEGGKIEFFDNEGNKLDNIPEKLGRLDKTIITLSAKIEKYAIEKLDKEDSILFNYLPTSDQRFGFPFLVNADFVSKTDREFIQIENKWNHYIFYHLGRKCIEWIAFLANITHDFKGKKLFSYVKTYLNLLPDELLDEDNEELASINISFNKGLTDAIDSIPFIIDANSNIRKYDEIVLDDTLLSTILGNGFFKQITKTQKELPLFQLGAEKLKKEYLNIERFKADDLIKVLSSKANKSILQNVLIDLKIDKYLEFLLWLDTFCNVNEVENDWILDLPIIRLGKLIITLNESLTKADFYLNNKRTIGLEYILRKAGFTISEFSIDESYLKHTKSIILQQDCYLKTDLKLYEHISAAKDLGKLSAYEKNTLISFFVGLVDVGPARYAKALHLFKSKKPSGSLKPLNSLISNNCVGLPVWLNGFVINVDEEKALAPTFQAQLLKEKDLLEKLFCNAENYNEIIANINSNNIKEFYSYILKLHKNKPEETKIDFSSIPWVYVESTTKFDLASSIYWPDGLIKFKDAKKYSSVRSVIETISDERLPHYAALQIKTPLSLGGKDFQITSINPKENAFDVITINDFLDWAETNGETELLNHFSFSKIGEKFIIGKISGTSAYYTSDKALIDFIEGSTLNKTLYLFSNELHSIDRNKIGLLEGVPLLKYIIENGQAVPSLAKFIQETKDSELAKEYIEKLRELNIGCSKKYTKEDAEFIILKLVSTQIIDDVAKLDSFREKIILDGVKLLEKAVSADVRMFDADNKFIYQFQGIEISDILPAYKGKTYPVSEIIELFVDFRDVESLRKIFKAKGRSTKKIYMELIDLKLEIYNAAQTFFLSYYQSLYPDEDILVDKIFFSQSPDTNKGVYKKELHLFLDYCFKNSYIDFVEQDILPSFTPIQLIYSDGFAIGSEKLPIWLSEWINSSDTDNKKAFIKQLRVNDDQSPVVLYRKAIQNAEAEPMIVNCALIDHDSLLINTLFWLKNESLVNNFVIKKEVLQPLYQKLFKRNVSAEKLLVPFLEKYQKDTYSLENLNEGDELHIINDGWGEYKQEIFSNLITSKKITDDVLPKGYWEVWKVIEKPFVKEPDIVNLISNSYQFDEDYYQEWDLKNQYNIQIYKGTELPYVIKYNDSLLVNISSGLAAYIGGVYYVVESIKENLFTFLAKIPEFKSLQSLRAQKQEFEEKKRETQQKILFTPEQIAAWHALFDNEIPESYKKNYNLASLVAALEALPNQGYIIDSARTNLKETHEYAQLDPVFDLEGNEYTIMSRSARGGLLYLTQQAWNRLDNESNTYLFADFGGGKSKFFKSKQDILDANEKHTDYQIVRIETGALASNVDSILNGTFDKSKIWIIFRVNENKDFDRLFYKDYEPNQGQVNTVNLGVSTQLNQW